MDVCSIREIIAKARAEGRASLDEVTGKAVLAHFGVRSPRSAVASDAADAEAKASGMSGPFVVKVVSPEILHKSDAGGVTLNLRSAQEVRLAVETMAKKPLIAAAKLDGWLVEEMIPPGREMVIGGYRDPQFGLMIMVGLGGIFVEILKDVSFRICPVEKSEARAMLDRIKGLRAAQRRARRIGRR